jgi:N-acyl-D-amino-acid deacylase
VGTRKAIVGGTVVDGSGEPPVRADVLVEDDRIAALLPDGIPDDLDAERVDAGGRVVAPGFIDVHAHADATLLAFRDAHSATRQGVTTVVNGNCGGGVAPAEPEHDVRRVAFAYEPSWGLEISWRTFGEYLAELTDIAVNAATLVPHGALRNAVMGMERRAPSSAELRRMSELLDDAMRAGAVGLSSGLEYQPGCNADVEELSTLAKVAARHDGVYATHMRNRAERFADATDEAIEVARRAGSRLQLSHFAPRPYAPAEQTERAFAAVDEFARGGNQVFVDTFPEVWGPGLLMDLFPRAVTRGTPAEVLKRLGDSAIREQVMRAFAAADNFLVRAAGYERIYISSNPVNPAQQGRPITELAEEAGTDLAGWACDALLEAGEAFPAVGIRHVYATEEDLRRLLTLPNCSLGSDGVTTCGEGAECPYPWSASSYGYTARTLEYYVRDVGLLTLEEAVRRLAALPADAIGLHDRGRVAAGKVADLVVVDPERVSDRTEPSDMARHPEGIGDVMVGGVWVVRDEAPCGERPGRVARGAGAR